MNSPEAFQILRRKEKLPLSSVVAPRLKPDNLTRAPYTALAEPNVSTLPVILITGGPGTIRA